MSGGLKHFTLPLVAFAVLLILSPMMEFAAAIWPVGLGNAEWRFGAVGLLSKAFLEPIIGSVIIVVIAAANDNGKLQKTMAVLNGLAAVFLLLSLPLFALDAIELRSRVPEAGRLSFDFATIKAVLVHALAVVVLGLLTRAGFKSAKRSEHRTEGTGDEAPVLITPEK